MTTALELGLELNNKCLAYHGPLLYEAKILKIHEPNSDVIKLPNDETEPIDEDPKFIDELKEQLCFFVHYRGWKASWDEWINQDRILPLNEQNLLKQKDLKIAIARKAKEERDAKKIKKEKSESPATANGSSTSSNSSNSHSNTHTKIETNGKVKKPTEKKNGKSSDSKNSNGKSKSNNNSANGHGPNGSHANDNDSKKKKLLETVESEDSFLKRPEITLQIPTELKSLLVDDWELITKNKKLVNLPSAINVEKILFDYEEIYFKDLHKGSVDYDNGLEIFQGLKLYFNRSLGSILLYQLERKQLKDLTQEFSSKLPSELYGVEHLLRLIVSLPGLMAQTSMDHQSISTIRSFLEKFLKYLNVNSEKYFIKDYENTSPAYEALSRR
ncbi:hypothetical protein B5S28_g905 [[Candida] boidinii]|uniref:Unnamed protein product n=1 Tax=Candida boidinii TaxID=5477 RepID=A0ACB5TVU2_CANBO|nr:hypothetical protein B5S28_g905 [[Candida] boidinii]OWB72373.1 hypothetical protein B5S31_g2081 [[Candida] boidinii]OWB77228.1 hypothetical protein B5S32_g1389 [[Candida] boidinii]GME95712.1 unnamed protein product [[Candida] boidinii]